MDGAVRQEQPSDMLPHSGMLPTRLPRCVHSRPCRKTVKTVEVCGLAFVFPPRWKRGVNEMGAAWTSCARGRAHSGSGYFHPRLRNLRCLNYSCLTDVWRLTKIS